MCFLMLKNYRKDSINFANYRKDSINFVNYRKDSINFAELLKNMQWVIKLLTTKSCIHTL